MIDRYVPKEEWPEQVTLRSTDSELVRCEEIIGRWLLEDPEIDTFFYFWGMLELMQRYIDAYSKNGISYSEDDALTAMNVIMEVMVFSSKNRQLDDVICELDYAAARYHIIQKHKLKLNAGQPLAYLYQFE